LAANRAPLTRVEVRIGAGEPSTETADRTAERLREFEPDLVVAVGGGSTIELAKAAWAIYEHADLDAERLLRVAALPGLRRRSRFIALPTTHGAGAEGTPSLGLFHRGRFREIRVPSLIPDRAILDPNLLAGLPRDTASASGFDALSHAVEAVLSTIPGPMADVQALSALSRLLRDLVPAVTQPDNQPARDSVFYASFMAGNAAGNKHLGLAHALADALGARASIPHGTLLAWVLPEVIRFNAEPLPEASEEKVASLMRAAGSESVDGFVRLLTRLRRDLGLTEGFPSIKPDGAPPPMDTEALKQEVLNSHHLRTNPRSVAAGDVHRILERCCEYR
jgi:alcohol dehydrogenase class IV